MPDGVLLVLMLMIGCIPYRLIWSKIKRGRARRGVC